MKLKLFLFAVLLVTLFSTCSFIYPFNPWDDPCVYMTIGNAMLQGKELYVDIFDHKGPVLFFMHEAAALLSRHSFVGIYLIEIVCCYFYLLYSWKTMRLLDPTTPLHLPRGGELSRQEASPRGGLEGVEVCLFLLGIITYSSDFFSYGDSVEEFSLPILAHCLYYMLRFAGDRKTPPPLQSVVMGVCFGLLFWTKFNLMFFYLGGILSLAFIAWKNDQMKELRSVVRKVTLGFALVTVLVLAYFAIHGTLEALWESYFVVNIFHYHGTGTNGEPDFWWFPLVKLAIWGLLMLPLVFLPARWEVKLLTFGTYGLLLFSYATMTVQFYYFLTIFTFFPLLICYKTTPRPLSTSPEGESFRGRKPPLGEVWKGSRLWGGFLVSLLAASTNWNLVSLLNGTFPHSVFEMAEIVNANKTEDSEVLTFSSYDTGIYLFTNHLPPNRNYFLSSILDPAIREEQAALVASGKIKYLVREIGAVNTCHEYYDAPIPSNYHLIYDNEELFRYRFITTPHKYLWNLIWTRPLLKYVMDPVTEGQHMQVYERRP